MNVRGLAHYSIRTPDLDATCRFYTDVLGLRIGFRPPFRFPGVWLYASEDESNLGVVHIIAIDPSGRDDLNEYLGRRSRTGSGSVDHVAFCANDWPEVRERCLRSNTFFTERVVPDLGLLQVFLKDPSGIVVELNFPVDEAE
jgi:catechol 2,3-dioxygenase-like lactoylglutathione lyase family enzyme